MLWKYISKDTAETVYIWTEGRITRVADGLTDTRSARARKILPAGAVLWAWDADASPDAGENGGERWLVLLPNKWNPSSGTCPYGWRFTPKELMADRAQGAGDEGDGADDNATACVVAARRRKNRLAHANVRMADTTNS